MHEFQWRFVCLGHRAPPAGVTGWCHRLILPVISGAPGSHPVSSEAGDGGAHGRSFVRSGGADRGAES